MDNPSNNIVVIAGEASGDMHAAEVVNSLKKKDPSLRFYGLGGPRMKAAGVHTYDDFTKIAVVGIWEVLKHFNEFKRYFFFILDKIDKLKPACVILVDYPGFNLRLAERLSAKDVKVVYYISPQVWAWKKKRIFKIKQWVDLMLVIFPFEEELYTRHNINVRFVGNPLVDRLESYTPDKNLLKNNALDETRMTIGLLPGSRTMEVNALLPLMLDAARLLLKEFPELQFLILKSPTLDTRVYEKYLGHNRIQLVNAKSYDAISACQCCVVASGTATLETAILEKPMVIVYRAAFLTWVLAKMVLRIPYIGMPNIIAGKKIVPELIQFNLNAKKIASELKRMFTDEIRIAEIKEELHKVKAALGREKSGRNAAEAILDLVRPKSSS